MENMAVARVGDLLVPDVDTITPNENVIVARRRMESQTARSLIVVEADRPVGVVQWRGLGQLGGDATVRDVMLTEVPILHPDMTIDEVRARLVGLDVDVDHLPVVDDSGTLIGEVPRGAITKEESATTAATEMVVAGPEQDRDAPLLHLEQGMTVVGVSGSKLGTVDQVDLNSEGRIAHFTVKYGLLTKHHKRLPADVIKGVDAVTVTVNLDQPELKMLADID